MAVARRVWRAAPATLLGVLAFLLLTAVGLPLLAYLVHRQGGHRWSRLSCSS